MRGLRELLLNTEQYSTRDPLRPASEASYYCCTAASSLEANRRIYVYLDTRDGFYAGVYETVALPVRPPSARIKNPRKRQLARIVWATVAPIYCYVTIADAVNNIAAKLREVYSEKYRTALDAPLESLVAAALDAEARPPGEA